MAFVPVQPNLFGAQQSQQHHSGGWSSPQGQHHGEYDQSPETFAQQGYEHQQQYGGGYNQQYDYGQQQGGGNPMYGQPGGFQQGYDGGQQFNGGHSVPVGPRPTSPSMGPGYVSPSPMHAQSQPGFGMFGLGGGAGQAGQGQFEAQFGQFGALASPIAQMGLASASQFVSNMNDSYVTRWTGSLRYYFSVNNLYVLNKLKILLFPFIHKSWSRKIVPAADGREMYLPPNQDVNAPDLYIPTMAFITYILLIAVIMATSSAGFKPDLLGVTASSGLVTLALEVLLIKLGFYLLSYPPVLILDLVAYCGYKFVGIILILIFGWTLGWVGFIASFVTLALFMAIFMVKTLRLVVPQPLEATPRNLRNYALISIAIFQGIFTGILCWMDSKNQAASRAF